MVYIFGDVKKRFRKVTQFFFFFTFIQLDEIHTKDLDKKQKSKDSTDDYDGYICAGQTLSSTTENHGATPKEVFFS